MDLCDIVIPIEKDQPDQASRLARDHVQQFNQSMRRREQAEKATKF